MRSPYTNFQQIIESSRLRDNALFSYLTFHSCFKLQLGTGDNTLEGWFNTDVAPASNIFFLDTTKRFPFDDETFHYVFSEHHLEHLTYSEGLFTLQECYRVLKPGGTLRLATPSLEVLLGLYTSFPNELQRNYTRFIIDTFLPMIDNDKPIFVINNAFRNWGHQFLYDVETLQRAMETAGFVDVTLATPGESNDEQLRGIEKHGQFLGNEEMNAFETMVLEGKKHP